MRVRKTETLFPHLVELRRIFHSELELTFEGVRTAKNIMAEFGRLGIVMGEKWSS